MYAAGTATKNISAFDPRSIPGCALWLDVADINTMTFSGTTVINMIDKSPYSNTITSASGQYSATSLGGYPGITSPRVYGTFTNVISTFIHTSFCVASAGGAGTGAAPFPLYEFNCVANGSSNHHLSILEYNPTGTYFRQARYVGVAVRTNTMTATTGTPFIWTASHNALASGLSTSYQCGSVLGTAGGTAPVSSSNGVYFNVGNSGWQGNVNSWSGVCSEILTYNRVLSSNELQAVEGYLSWKWGVNTNIPTGHPYRTVFPALRAFTPLDLSTMPALWLDSANAGTITSNTSNVTTWSNSGTNGYNATSNAAGSNTGLTGVATQNNLNLIQFSNYSFMSLPAEIFTVSERSCFFAFKVQTNISGSFMILLAGTNSIGGAQETGIDYIGANPIFFLQRNGIGPFISFSTITSPVNSFLQCSFVNSATTTASNAGSVNGSNLPLMSNVLANYTLNEPYYISYSNISRNWQSGDMIIYNSAISSNNRQLIEGYLGWKWGITSLMPTTHPYKYSMPMSIAFNPRSLSNCLFWFDAADATSITSNTSNVTTWTNKGIAQVNALSNASYTTGRTGITTINGLNAINFVAGASMTLDNISTPLQARSMFVVTRNLTDLNGAASPYQGYLNPGVGGQFWQNVFLTYGGGTYSVLMGPNSIGFSVGFNLPSNPLNITNLYGFVNNTSSALNAGTLNGSNISLSFSSNANDYITTAVPALLATPGYNTGQDIAEYIQYDYALTPSERYRVEGYLAWKWGLASSLPANHPFKKAAP
jgi:hypothetical protein